MTTTLITEIIIAIFLIIWFLISFLMHSKGYKDLDYSGSISLSIILFIALCLYGFGICGYGATDHYKETPTKNIKVCKSSYEIACVDTTTNTIYIFDKMKDYKMINDSTKFYYNISYNIYNVEINRTLIYK